MAKSTVDCYSYCTHTQGGGADSGGVSNKPGSLPKISLERFRVSPQAALGRQPDPSSPTRERQPASSSLLSPYARRASMAAASRAAVTNKAVARSLAPVARSLATPQSAKAALHLCLPPCSKPGSVGVVRASRGLARSARTAAVCAVLFMCCIRPCAASMSVRATPAPSSAAIHTVFDEDNAAARAPLSRYNDDPPPPWVPSPSPAYPSYSPVVMPLNPGVVQVTPLPFAWTDPTTGLTWNMYDMYLSLWSYAPGSALVVSMWIDPSDIFMNDDDQGNFTMQIGWARYGYVWSGTALQHNNFQLTLFVPPWDPLVCQPSPVQGPCMYTVSIGRLTAYAGDTAQYPVRVVGAAMTYLPVDAPMSFAPSPPLLSYFVLRLSQQNFTAYGPTIAVSLQSSSGVSSSLPVYMSSNLLMYPNASQHYWMGSGAVASSPVDQHACLPGVNVAECNYFVGVDPYGLGPDVTLNVTAQLKPLTPQPIDIPWFTIGSKFEQTSTTVSVALSIATFVVNLIVACVLAKRMDNGLSIGGVMNCWSTNKLTFHSCELIAWLWVLLDFVKILGRFVYLCKHTFMPYDNPRYKAFKFMNPFSSGSVTDMDTSKFVWLGPEYARYAYRGLTNAAEDSYLPACHFPDTVLTASPPDVCGGAGSYESSAFTLSGGLMDGVVTKVAVALGVAVLFALKVNILVRTRKKPPVAKSAEERAAEPSFCSLPLYEKLMFPFRELGKFLWTKAKAYLFIVLGLQQFCVLMPLYTIHINPYCIVLSGKNLVGGICLYKVIIHLYIIAVPFTAIQMAYHYFFCTRWRKPEVCGSCVVRGLGWYFAVAFGVWGAYVLIVTLLYVFGGMVLGTIWSATNFLSAKYSLASMGLAWFFATIRPFRDASSLSPYVFLCHLHAGAVVFQGSRLRPVSR